MGCNFFPFPSPEHFGLVSLVCLHKNIFDTFFFFFNHQQKCSSSCLDVCAIQLSRFSLSLPSWYFPMYQSLCNVWKVMAGYGVFHGKLKLV